MLLLYKVMSRQTFKQKKLETILMKQPCSGQWKWSKESHCTA